MTRPFGGGLPYERSLSLEPETPTGCVRLEMGAPPHAYTLYQAGGLRVRFPHATAPDCPEAVLINTAGGVVGGDGLAVDIVLREGGRLSVSTAAAEKFYGAAADKPPARFATRLWAEDRSLLEWLPQESIYFTNCRLERKLVVKLSSQARFIGVEMVLWGRRARGELLEGGEVRELVVIEREGSLLLYEPTRLTPPIAARLAAAARGGEAAGTALLIYAAPDAEKKLEVLRQALSPWPLAQASLPAEGLLIARLLSAEGRELRSAAEAGLDVLRDGRALPRLWRQ
jgi:urease accessory protein